MFAFLGTTLLIVGTPGPATVSLGGVSMAYGLGAGLRYMAGLITGGSLSHFVLWAVISGGLWALASTIASPQVISVLEILVGLVAVGLLFWVAWKIGTATGGLKIEAASQAPGFWQGVMLNLVNPKVYAGMMSLYYAPGFDLGWSSSPAEFAFKFVAIVVLAIVTHVGWVVLGAWLGGLEISARKMRVMNLSFAAVLVAVTLYALWSLVGASVGVGSGA